MADLLQATGAPIDVFTAGVMKRFAPGLFVKLRDQALPDNNLDLERWFKRPRGHERRIHGRAHAGVRIVIEGPTLLPTLDAHMRHPTPFTAEDLVRYRNAGGATIAARRGEPTHDHATGPLTKGTPGVARGAQKSLHSFSGILAVR